MTINRRLSATMKKMSSESIKISKFESGLFYIQIPGSVFYRFLLDFPAARNTR